MNTFKCWSVFCLVLIFSSFHAKQVYGQTEIDGDITSSDTITIAGTISMSSVTVTDNLAVSTITAVSSATISNLTASNLISSSLSISTITAVSSATITNLSVSGALTSSGNLSFSNTSLYGVVGSTTNDSAATGNVGQYVYSSFSSTSATSSGNYMDATSISLAAGDWMVVASGTLNPQDQNVSGSVVGFSTTPGNSGAGLVYGISQLAGNPKATIEGYMPFTVIGRLSLASTTTVYLKFLSTYTGNIPSLVGALQAWRIR